MMRWFWLTDVFVCNFSFHIVDYAEMSAYNHVKPLLHQCNVSWKGSHNFILVTGVMNKRSKLMSSRVVFLTEQGI